MMFCGAFGLWDLKLGGNIQKCHYLVVSEGSFEFWYVFWVVLYLLKQKHFRASPKATQEEKGWTFWATSQCFPSLFLLWQFLILHGPAHSSNPSLCSFCFFLFISFLVNIMSKSYSLFSPFFALFPPFLCLLFTNCLDLIFRGEKKKRKKTEVG